MRDGVKLQGVEVWQTTITVPTTGDTEIGEAEFALAFGGVKNCLNYLKHTQEPRVFFYSQSMANREFVSAETIVEWPSFDMFNGGRVAYLVSLTGFGVSIIQGEVDEDPVGDPVSVEAGLFTDPLGTQASITINLDPSFNFNNSVTFFDVGDIDELSTYTPKISYAPLGDNSKLFFTSRGHVSLIALILPLEAP